MLSRERERERERVREREKKKSQERERERGDREGHLLHPARCSTLRNEAELDTSTQLHFRMAIRDQILP